MTKILSFDLGATFGWSAVQQGLVTHFGSITLTSKDRGGKFFAFGTHVDNLIGLYNPDLLFYECPIPGFPNTVRLLWGYAAKVEEAAATYELEVDDAFPSTIKKFFTGNGKATKPEMIAKAAHLVHPLYINNDHEADAIALGLYARHMLENKDEQDD